MGDGTAILRILVTALALPLGGAALSCAPSGGEPGADATAMRAADLWDWCPAPTPASEVPDDRLWVQFGEGALYCTVELPTWDSSVTAWSQLADKAQLRLVPGDNFLPLESGEHDVTLPLCARTADADAPTRTEPGPLVVERTQQLGRDRLDLTYLHTVVDAEGEAVTAFVRVSGYEDDLGAGVLLDGAAWPIPDPDVRLALCRGERCGAEDPVSVLDACRFDGVRELHELRFDGGRVRFVIERKPGPSPVRMRLVSAEGAIDTEPFAQESFWGLVGRETWPFSSARDIAVAFDAPAAGFCGLHATQLYDGNTNGTVELRRCSGDVTTRILLSHTVALEEPVVEEPPAP